MRKPRSWQLESGRHFHCVSRVVDRQYFFGATEREVFRGILRKVEAFSGVKVLTWTMLSNHFHVLVYVPDEEELTEGEILRRVGKLYGAQRVREVKWQLEQWEGREFEAARREFLAKYTRRMWNLSEFMKSLKQRFSVWFNRANNRRGTLWEERFRSVAVGGSWQAVLIVAAYIDLNCVRAGLASDPKDYRWCGYAEAVAGDRRARGGLARVLGEEGQSMHWSHAGAVYRSILFGSGAEGIARRGFSREQIRAELSRGGVLTREELLRCRVRYFTDGAVLGTRDFVNRFFEARREQFGPSRQSGARKMRGGDWGDLTCLRDLQKEVIACN